MTRKDELALSHLRSDHSINVDSLQNEVLSFFSKDTAIKGSSQKKEITEIRKSFIESDKVFSSKTGSYRTNSLNENIAVSDIPFYLFSFKNTSGEASVFAITCGDDRIGSILAITKEGDADKGANNPFLAVFLTNLEQYIEETVEIYNSITDEDIKEALRKKTDIVKSLKAVSRESAADPWLIIQEIKDAAVPTYWSQGSPYNAVASEALGKTVVAGCVAVACGQIMAKHRYPPKCNLKGYTDVEYDWNTMLQYPIVFHDTDAANMVSTLLYEIGKNVHMDYGAELSEAYQKYVAPCFEKMGYTAPPSLMSYNFTKIKYSLVNGNPVYIFGAAKKIVYTFLWLPVYTSYKEGHTWVIDGYLKRQNTDSGEIEEYVYCNLGWGYHWNGYYLNKVFDTNNLTGVTGTRSGTSHYYKYNLQIVPDLCVEQN